MIRMFERMKVETFIISAFVFIMVVMAIGGGYAIKEQRQWMKETEKTCSIVPPGTYVFKKGIFEEAIKSGEYGLVFNCNHDQVWTVNTKGIHEFRHGEYIN